MLFKQFRKIVGLNKSSSIKTGRAAGAIDYITDKIKEALKESQIIMDKLHDLHKTNYNLAVNHLENDNISEAIFRFKIVRKFWPEDYNAHCKLIYCYYLQEDNDKADTAIDYLLYLSPRYKTKINKLKLDALSKINELEKMKKKESEEIDNKETDNENSTDDLSYKGSKPNAKKDSKSKNPGSDSKVIKMRV